MFRSLCQPCYGNIAPLQIEFDTGLSRKEIGAESVAQLVQTHLAIGHPIAITLLDKDVIMDAHQDPETQARQNATKGGSRDFIP